MNPLSTLSCEENMGGGKMGVLPHEAQEVSGFIMAWPFAKPSIDGAVVCIQTSRALQEVLDRAERLGSEI